MSLPKYLAELLGTFVLTLVVWLSIAFGQTVQPISTPVAAALVLGLFVYTIGGISGAHLNPAVTCAFMAQKKMKLEEGAFYIIAQFIGAVLAMVIGRIATGATIRVSAGDSLGVVFAEALGAFILVFGISSVATKKVPPAASGLVVGGSLLLGITIASVSGLSNGVLNPAVAIGIGSANLYYMLGPVIGAVIGAYAYQYVSEA